MPYNPGVQDISGQLIAQGMSQAGAARAQAVQNLGQSIGGAITSGIKQYQQNQFLTKQAMGKFGGQLQDPNFKKYVDGVLSEDPNAPTVPEPLKKALQNAQKGQVDVYDAALLGNMVDAYQDNLKGQLLRAQIAQAEAAARPKPIPGQRMTFEQADAFRKANPGFDVKFIPAPGAPNEVILQTLNTRAEPAAPSRITGQIGGGLAVINQATGQLESVIPDLPPGMQPTNVAALQQFRTPPTSAAPAGAAAPATAAVPASLSRFQGAAQAPAGPMAALGQFAGAPRAVAAAPAPTPAPAPAAPAAPAGTGLAFKPIPGSEQAVKAAEAKKMEAGKFQLAMESYDTQLKALDRVIPEISGRTTGWGSLLQYVPGTKAKQMAVDLAPIRAQEAFTGITQLKEAGGSLGQVAIYEVKLLENRRSAIDQATSPEDFKKRVLEFREEVKRSKERMQILARDRAEGRDQPSDDYFAAGGYWPGVEPKAPNIRKLPIQRGSEPGTSTLGTSRPKFGPQYEGKTLINPQGQRVRIVNGQEVPIK